jgi:hypothetical protein
MLSDSSPVGGCSAPGRRSCPKCGLRANASGEPGCIK